MTRKTDDGCHCRPEKVYDLDAFYTADDSPSDVFAKEVEPIISRVVAGFNATVFAYGPTGSGKTYLMQVRIHSFPALSSAPQECLLVLPLELCIGSHGSMPSSIKAVVFGQRKQQLQALKGHHLFSLAAGKRPRRWSHPEDCVVAPLREVRHQD